ncbi:hypothetical protein ACFQZ4_47170 [Catellatospora coxensis]
MNEKYTADTSGYTRNSARPTRVGATKVYGVSLRRSRVSLGRGGTDPHPGERQ